jgi:uncharacterized protein
MVLFKGKVCDVERRSSDGFVRGKAVVEGFGEFHGEKLRVEFKNKNLIAKIGGQPVAIVPDLITFLDSRTGIPITAEGLKYGFRVICLGIPTPDIMRSPAALKVWGPRYFGYNYITNLWKGSKKGRCV